MGGCRNGKAVKSQNRLTLTSISNIEILMGKEGISHQNCGFYWEGAWELKGQSEHQIPGIEMSELHKYWVN